MKSEVGIFFPMLVLRVLENVLQPSFVQKMTVLSLLENICHDPNLIIDIFVNFDCDVESPNIFERCLQDCQRSSENCSRASSWFIDNIVPSPGYYFSARICEVLG
jgi:Sec7-like guanine-nucleotide exchange factor